IQSFGGSGANLGGFGGTGVFNGGFTEVETSILTNVTVNDGNNLAIQSLNTNAVQVLNAAIASFGGSGPNLGGFGGTGVFNGGYTEVETALLQNVTLYDGHNLYIQSLDASAVQVLNTAISSFGGSGPTLGGCGGTGVFNGGYTAIETTVLTSVTANDGHNLYIQSLDANAVQVLDAAIASFGGSGPNLGGFGGTGVFNGGFTDIHVTLVTNVTANGGNNTYTASLDANALQVLNTALQSFG